MLVELFFFFFGIALTLTGKACFVLSLGFLPSLFMSEIGLCLWFVSFCNLFIKFCYPIS